MRERLITLVCALGSALLFVALVLPGQGTHAAARPTTEAADGSGYRAAQLWLQGEGIRVLSLREPFGALAYRSDVPARGSLLIVTLPAAEPFSGAELRGLSRWVEAGNTLLVLAALADAPEWAFAGGSEAAADVNRLTGLTVEPAGRHVTRDEWGRGTLVPTRTDVWFEGVRQAVALSDHPAQSWRMKLPRESFVLALGRQAETAEEALWAGTQGRGRIIVSAFGSLFSDRAMGLSGNAQLLANLVAGTVGPEGVVLFDDYHQGLSELYDPARFYHDPRLYQTLAVLAAVWLAWLLAGSPRQLRAAAPVPFVPGEAELVCASGRMLARVLPPAAAARGLLAGFFLRARGRLGVREGLPWEALERHPGISQRDLAQLSAWHEASQAGGRVPLAPLHSLIQRIERQLTA
jgi:hypothetical protein